MYVLARHEGESILIADGLIKLKVLSVTGKIVRLGFDAPREIDIIREELKLRGDANEGPAG